MLDLSRVRGTSVLVACLCSFLVGARCDNLEELQVSGNPLVPGIYEDLVEEHPALYTSYAPIVFEFKRPNWTDLNVNGSVLENCDKNYMTDKKGLLACPVAKAIEQITGSLSDSVGDLLRFAPGPNASSSPLDYLVDSISCKKISPHFKVGFSRTIDADDYLSTLSSCPLVRELLLHEQVNSTGAQLTPILNEALRIFDRNYSSRVAIVDSIAGSALSELSYTSLQGILLGDVLLDAVRWSTALAHCSALKIPRTLLGPTEISRAVAEVKEKLLRYSYELSIPEDHIYKLYNLKISDCAFTTKDTFLVRVLVPIKDKKVDSFKLYNLLPLPSVYKTDIDYKICEPTDIPAHIVHSLDVNERHGVSCGPMDDRLEGSLCYVSFLDKNGDLTIDHSFDCASAILNNESDEVKLKYCKSRVHCSSFDLDEAPYYRQVTPNTVFMSVVNSHYDRFNMSIVCKGVLFKKLDIHANSSEYLITLPCDCALMENTHLVFKPGPPCRNVSINPGKVQKWALPELILQPKYLLPNESALILKDLKVRLEKMELMLEAATERSLSALSNRSLYVVLIVLLLVVTGFLSIWGLRLWRWKRQAMLNRNNYVMFDQTSALNSDEAAL